MTEDQKDRVLAESLEEFHRQRARGESPDLDLFRAELGNLYEEFFELVVAETAIDQALDSGSEQALPQNWGPYLLLGEIGRGAAGVVYEAMHRQLGRKVALKVLRTGVDTDSTARERFRREAQALAQVRHDHIVEIYEYGELGDRLFYSMSLVEGPSLAVLNKTNQRPAPEDLCRGMAGIADALQALHEAGIVHRDVKPSNIMIAPNGRYLLADFGLARTDLAETMTQTGDALGTPLYMSPEQMLGKRDAVEARTDVYGLGASLYQLLTGQPPFKTDNLHALMRMVLSQRPQNPRLVAPELPPGCARIALKCLEKEAADRYESAGALAADLRAFADGERVSGKPVTGTQRSLRLVKRRPLLAAASIAAAVLVALGVVKLMEPEVVPTSSLSVHTAQAAFVHFDGGTYPAPMDGHPVQVGKTYPLEVVPEEAGYKPYRQTVTGRDRHDINIVLPAFQPADAGDPISTAATLARLGVAPSEAVGMIKTHRGADDHSIEALFPRGLVREQGIRELTLRFNHLFDPDVPAFLEIRRGKDGEDLLYRAPFPGGDREVERVPMPKEVLEQIRPGEEISWGYYVDMAKADRHARRRVPHDLETATFTLIDPALAGTLEARKTTIEKATESWDENTRAVIRASALAELYLANGLYQAAWTEVRPLVGELVRKDDRLVFERGPHATPGLVELERKILRGFYPGALMQDAFLYDEVVGSHRGLFSDSEWADYASKLQDAKGAASGGKAPK